MIYLDGNSRISIFKTNSIQIFDEKFNNPIFKIDDPQFIVIKEKIKNMSLRDKLSQMIMINASGNQISENFVDTLNKYKPRVIILMGKNISEGLLQFVQYMQKTNSNTPLFIAIDQEGGPCKAYHK